MPRIAYECPHCGSRGEADAAFLGLHVRCKACEGKVLLTTSPASTPAPPAAPPDRVAVPLRMMTCPDCSSPWRDGALICIECGYGTRFEPSRPAAAKHAAVNAEPPAGGGRERLLGTLLEWGAAAVGVGLGVLAVRALPGEGLDFPETSRAVVPVGNLVAAGLASLVFVYSLVSWLAGKSHRGVRGAVVVACLLIGCPALAGVGFLASRPISGQWGLTGVVLSWGVVAGLTLILTEVFPVEGGGPAAMVPRPGTRRRGVYVSLAGVLTGSASADGLGLIVSFGLELFGLGRRDEPGSVPLYFAIRCGQFVLAGAVAAALARRAKVTHALAAGCLLAATLAVQAHFSQAPGGSAWALGFGRAAMFLPLAILGGELEIVLPRVSRRLAPREAGTYRTTDGRPIEAYPPWRDLTLACVWYALAFSMLAFAVSGVAVIVFPMIAFCLAPLTVAPATSQGPPTIMAAVIIAICLLNAVVFHTLGRRRWAPSAVERLRRDQDPPVVYLRSFRDDGRRLEEGVFHELGNAFMSVVGRTVEQRLAAILRRVGPVVAIGRPGEELPEEGAARMYVADGDWQAMVVDLLTKASLVVLQVGDSAGLHWEIEKVGELMEPERVLLFAPFDSRRDRRVVRRAEYYRRTREAIGGLLPGDMPSSIGDASLIYFTATPPGAPRRRWVPHVLEPGRPAPLGHPLTPWLDRFARSRAFRRPRNIRGLTVALVGVLATILGFVLIALTIACFAEPEIRGWPVCFALAILGSVESGLVWVIHAGTSGRLD